MDNHHEEKLSLLQELIALSKADNDVSFIEMHFIHQVAANLNVSEEELEALKNNSVSYQPQNKETDRITQFYRLLLLMNVDTVRNDNEIKFCKNAGLKMGLNPTAINEIIRRMTTSENGIIPPQEMIQIFQTHHN